MISNHAFPSLLAGWLATCLLLGCSSGPEKSRDGVYTGYVEAQLLYVAAPSAGWLTSSPWQEGDPVEVGDLLFELESELERAQLDEASNRFDQLQAQAQDLSTGARREEIEPLEAQLAEARANLELAALERRRIAALVEQGIIAARDGDRASADEAVAEARVRSLEASIEAAHLAGRRAARAAALAGARAAEATVRQARWRRDERQVKARASGRVEEIFHRSGEFVPAASPVLSLLPRDSLEVRFFVPQEDLSRVEPGARVDVFVDGPSAAVSARVTYVARQAEFTPPVIYSLESRDKLVFLVRAALDGPSRLRPGQPVDVRVP